jgi:glucose-6-phosphate dehydrogenase assembly protein OpcA
MTTTLWDTNGTEIVKTLSAERRAAGALASGLAATLIVVVEEEDIAEAEAAAMTAAAAHPCRLLIVVRRRLEADDRLDAEVQVGGRLGANEAVVMRMYGRLTLHAESVVLPLLASDAPVVTWWHGQPPEKLAYDALGVLASRRVTDSSVCPEPVKELKRRAKDYAPGDTDLAWTRTTPWRGLLASAFDDVTAAATSAEVAAATGNPSAVLMAGWLTSRLGVRCRVTASDGPGVTAVEVRFEGREKLRIDRPDGYLAVLSRSGLPDRRLPLKRRDLGELLAEELRRLDADQPYSEALAVMSGESDLSDRPATRTHIWRDPTGVGSAAKRGSTTKTASPKKAAGKKAAGKKAAAKKPAKKTGVAAAEAAAAKTKSPRRSGAAARTTARRKTS